MQKRFYGEDTAQQHTHPEKKNRVSICAHGTNVCKTGVSCVVASYILSTSINKFVYLFFFFRRRYFRLIIINITLSLNAQLCTYVCVQHTLYWHRTVEIFLREKCKEWAQMRWFASDALLLVKLQLTNGNAALIQLVEMSLDPCHIACIQHTEIDVKTSAGYRRWRRSLSARVYANEYL